MELPGGLVRFLEVWEQFWWGETQKNNHGFWEEWKLKPWWSAIFSEVLPYASWVKKAHDFIVHCAQKSHSCNYHSPESTTSSRSTGIMSVGLQRCLFELFNWHSKTLPRNDISSVSFNCRRSAQTKMLSRIWQIGNILLSQCCSTYPKMSYFNNPKSQFNCALVGRESKTIATNIAEKL